MTKLDLTKSVINFIVGAGTTKIVSQVVQNNTNPKNAAENAQLVAGSVVLGCMAADATREYTNAKIDEIADWWKTNITKSNDQ